MQDQLKKEGSELSKLIINKDAIIYVCGDAKNMSKDVNSAFSQVLADNSGKIKSFYLKKLFNINYLSVNFFFQIL